MIVKMEDQRSAPPPNIADFRTYQRALMVLKKYGLCLENSLFINLETFTILESVFKEYTEPDELDQCLYRVARHVYLAKTFIDNDHADYGHIAKLRQIKINSIFRALKVIYELYQDFNS